MPTRDTATKHGKMDQIPRVFTHEPWAFEIPGSSKAQIWWYPAASFSAVQATITGCTDTSGCILDRSMPMTWTTFSIIIIQPWGSKAGYTSAMGYLLQDAAWLAGN